MRQVISIRFKWMEIWKQVSITTILYWVLRLAVGGEFIGHGMAGIGGNPQWVHYFAVVGISPQC